MTISHKTRPNTQKEIHSIMNPLFKKWFTDKFTSLALPQKYALMEIHCRKNILVSSPTGSGKTLTAFGSILNELIDSAQKCILKDKVYCVYVSPLKALSRDIQINLLEPLAEIEQLHGSPLGIRVGVRTGDTTTKEKQAMTKKAPHIFITTPESLNIMLTAPKFREHLMNVEWFICDEIHALGENKRGVDLSLAMERLQYLSPGMCRVGLSATVAPIDKIAAFLVGQRDCLIVNVQFLKEIDLQVMSPVKDLIDTDYKDMHHALYETIHSLILEHKTTLIFTNTRAATERVVHYLKEKFPEEYFENIGAHHGSLSKEHRSELESNLRAGKLRAVVCSTSLELGIDIGFIDLVILLGSPKSVARCLQRVGRSGHQLHSVTKGRIIVLDRDDLVECSVLLKSAIEKKIDHIHIPTLALDVLAQHVIGMAVEQEWHEDTMLEVIKRSYCYRDLDRVVFMEIIEFLAGKFSELEDRHVYARIYHEGGRIRRRGKLARMLYMTNLGTIPDRSGVKVKCGGHVIGTVDEGFLEKLRKRDIFVLGGNTYEFRFARGMSAEVSASIGKPPTVPSWVSQSLPLSFDLACAIGVFRQLMLEKLERGISKNEIIKFIHEYLYVDSKAANSLFEYFKEQYDYVGMIPNSREIIIEQYWDEKLHHYIFHTLYGRRVNDVLSRAFAFAVSRILHRDVDIGINDNGFYLTCQKKVDVAKAMKHVKSKELRELMTIAIDKTEVLKRRFRHCAGRAFMILRNYMGRRKRVGRQQVSSMVLLAAVRRVSEKFPILREARREVLEDQMDIENAVKVLEWIEMNGVKVKKISTNIPTPFAFKIVLQGALDVMKIEDKVDFLRNMQKMVKVKIGLRK